MLPFFATRTLRHQVAVIFGTIGITATSLIASTNTVTAYSSRVENACREDYFRFCPSYPTNSASLRICMESKANQLSKSCVSALIDGGYVDRRRLKRN